VSINLNSIPVGITLGVRIALRFGERGTHRYTPKPIFTRVCSIITGTVVALVALVGEPASAEVVSCTTIPSVDVSHFVTHNNDYGGHLNAHILGQTPPVGYTQRNKTLFSSDHDWEEAYMALANQTPALQCNTSAALNTVAARTLPWQFFSEQCTAANGAGQCTAHNTIQTNHVNYVLRVVSDGPRRRWIVYTAYPTP
jgi:hypothetical protein